MTNTILPQDDIHTELVSSLVDNGWTGKWELKNDVTANNPSSKNPSREKPKMGIAYLCYVSFTQANYQT